MTLKLTQPDLSLERQFVIWYNRYMKVISYVRVSTQRQGESGLGLEAQREAVAVYCKAHGFSLIEEFVEVESGRKTCRPVLLRALQAAKRAKAVLLIAKIDRLARNVAFIANMMEAGVEFRACDMPEANRLMLHIMAAFAEHEARTISERTNARWSCNAQWRRVVGVAGGPSPSEPLRERVTFLGLPEN